MTEPSEPPESSPASEMSGRPTPKRAWGGLAGSILVAVLVTVLVFWGMWKWTTSGDSDTANSESTSESTTPTGDDAALAKFCSANDVLDATDGTEEYEEALAAIEDLESNAPVEIAEDVTIAADTSLVSRFPAQVDASRQVYSLEVFGEAKSRLDAFVDENCA